MKIAISGSRSIEDRDWLYGHLDRLLPEGAVLLSGGARGVDTLVEEYAKAEGIDHILFKPYHMLDSKVPYQKKFFFVRNRQLIDNADKVVIFWDGESGGTAWCIDYATKTHKLDVIVKYTNDGA
jgi:predicted Rossmann fold nucleotide-binding protein DprA/Smf involved in DNA uptake